MKDFSISRCAPPPARFSPAADITRTFGAKRPGDWLVVRYPRRRHRCCCAFDHHAALRDIFMRMLSLYIFCPILAWAVAATIVPPIRAAFQNTTAHLIVPGQP